MSGDRQRYNDVPAILLSVRRVAVRGQRTAAFETGPVRLLLPLGSTAEISAAQQHELSGPSTSRPGIVYLLVRGMARDAG